LLVFGKIQIAEKSTFRIVLSHQWSGEDEIKGADQNHWPIRRRCPAK